MLILLLASTPESSAGDLPPEAHDTPQAISLFVDVSDFIRALSNTPSVLTVEVQDAVKLVRRAAIRVENCLAVDRTHKCPSDGFCNLHGPLLRSDLPWNRCEGKICGGECVEGADLMACSKVRPTPQSHCYLIIDSVNPS